MKTKYLKIIGIILLAMPLSMQAQEKGTEQKKEIGLIPIPVFTGEIINWHSTLDYIYYAFDFKVGDSVYVVEFPTTLGSKIRSLGESVTIHGFIKNESKYYKKEEIDFINIKGKKKVVYKEEAKDVNTATPKKFVSGKGKELNHLINEWGQVIGLIIDEKTILIASISALEQVKVFADEKTIIEYTGKQRLLKSGEVAKPKWKAVYCHTVSINGRQYLLSE